MVYLWSTILVSLNAAWLLVVVFGLPGNWLIVISTCLFAWWRWDEGVFSIYTLIAILVLAVLGELVEFSAGMIGARKSGAGWPGSIAALLGGVTGAVLGTFLIPIPFFGALLGACLGAGLCVWGMEFSRGKKAEHSLRYAVGAGLGEFFGIISKFALGIIIWFVVAVAAFWP
ncbi:MAG: DUF456 domain-containing protein [Planctomycetes bacterium]|nr:DUF456 domain-containing protein [Planctomycetota bacterium]MCH8120746.1 DUF456 domain-containing protein [Planctomycetota bacterium]